MTTKNEVTNPKFKVGEFVFSPISKGLKREIKSIKITRREKFEHEYRLLLFDLMGRPFRSSWIKEEQLKKENNFKIAEA